MSRYIDADNLKERIPKDIHEDVFENCSNCELLDDEQVKELIDLQPTADVRENVRGEWIRKKRIEPVYDIDGVKTWGIKCQCCKCDFSTIVVEDFGYYQFCPNCGADMRGE